MGDIGEGRIDQYVPLSLLRTRLASQFTMTDLPDDTGGPARYVRVAETGGKIGFITPMTHNFCESCNRVRITCTGTTEPDVGSDPRGVKTRADDDGPDHFRVTGRKLWITNASICDLINVTCSVGKDDRGLANMIRLMIDRDESPFEAHEIPTLGLRQGHLGEVAFDNCRVPKANMLGEAGDAARVLTLTWLANRPIIALSAVHMAQRAFDLALRYAGDRKQFGKVIGGHQLVQKLLADTAMAITTSRLLCYHALEMIDAGERANQISAMAKRYSLEACQRAISMAMEVHGAMGISRELGLEQLFRDCRMLPIPDGTNQILALIEGRELTGIQAYRA